MIERRMSRMLIVSTVMLSGWSVSGCGDRTSDELPVRSGPIAERQIVAMGRIQPLCGVIEISAMPGERLERLEQDIVVGKEVGPDAILGYVGSYAARKAQVEAARSRLELAKKQREQDIALADAQVQKAKAELTQAEAKMAEVEAEGIKLQSLADASDVAEQDLETLEQLRQDNSEFLTDGQALRKRNLSYRVIREYEAGKRAYDAALKAAQATVSLAEENVRLAQASRQRVEQLDQADALEKEVKAAEELERQCTLRTPSACTLPGCGPGYPFNPAGEQPIATDACKFQVLHIATRPGSMVTQLPILQVADLRRMACLAEVYEADVKELYVGQNATLVSPAFSGKYSSRSDEGPQGIRGKIYCIGKMITSPALANRNPLGPGERSIAEVLVEIDPVDADALKQARELIGLQVRVYFEAKSDEPGATPAQAAAEAETPETPAPAP